MPYVPMANDPSTSDPGSRLRWSEIAMKLGSEGLSRKRLYSKLRPVDAFVELIKASTVEREVNPRPKIPSAY